MLTGILTTNDIVRNENILENEQFFENGNEIEDEVLLNCEINFEEVETDHNHIDLQLDKNDRLKGKFVSPNVVNLSKRDLTEGEISLLSKGLKFCPAPKDLDRGKIKTDLEEFGRRLRLKWLFREENNAFETNPFRPKSTFKPPRDDVAIEIYLSRLEEEILSISERGNNYSNLNASEQEALKTLRNDPTIIIKEADKGSAVVVWDREDYLKEADNHLLNSASYSECEGDPTNNVLETVRSCLDKSKGGEI